MAEMLTSWACRHTWANTSEVALHMMLTREGLQAHGAFTLVLSGGSLLKALGKLVGMPGVEYAKWHVFYVDERNVPYSSDDCTHKGAHEAFLSKVRPLLVQILECMR